MDSVVLDNTTDISFTIYARKAIKYKVDCGIFGGTLTNVRIQSNFPYFNDPSLMAHQCLNSLMVIASEKVSHHNYIFM